jgi:hypothetical protein
MGRFASKQKPPDAGTPVRAQRRGAPSASREARPPMSQTLLVDRRKQAPTLTPLAEFLLSEEHPLSREAPRLPYSLPRLAGDRWSPPVRRVKAKANANDPAIEDPKKVNSDEQDAVQGIPGKAIIQRQPVPGALPDRLEPRTKGANPTPKRGAPGKPGDRISEVRGLNTEIQGKLAFFRQQKEWRAQFHADIKQKFAVIAELSKELDEIEKELQENESGWYVFEYEPAKWTWAKWTRLMKRIDGWYWETRNTAEAEEKYEAESKKTEADLRKQQESLAAEIRTHDKAGDVLSQPQYESLASRLKQLSGAIDKLSDAELRAQVKYTGSGPVSRPE